MDEYGSKWGGKWADDECSVIGDKGEIGFIDFDDEKSACSYNPEEEGPIVVSVPFTLVHGKQPQSAFVGERVADLITVKNTTCDPVDLWGIKIYASNPENTYTLSLMKPPSSDSDAEGARGFLESFSLEDRVLQPGDTLNVWLSCQPKEIGMHTSVVHFDLETEKIERVVFLLAEDKISQSLASKAPYSRSNKKKLFNADQFVVGSRPSRAKNRFFKNRLPRYDIPYDIRELLQSKQIPDAVLEGLSVENYASFFKTLLIMEELQLEEDMRMYDMEHVTLRKRGSQFLSLEVPGLAEKRPSLVHGDFIFAKLASECEDDETPPYQGFIHRVEADEVYLKFAPEFHLYHRDGNLYNVHFTYNRINMRRLYQAIEAAEELEPGFLFPSESTFESRLITRTPLVPMSCLLNEEQMFSIEMILGCRGAPPYVIHGPPGTGKTVTIVEAILQLYRTQKDTHILVCTPSNSAADHILEKLLSEKAVIIKENELFRLNASTRPYADVNPNHIRFCFFNDLIFQCPPIRALLRYRIIISTYVSASLLYAEGVRRGHFSHIFLDEAGQASEPEMMVPISNLCHGNTVVVLAGDPMQLGPVVYSKEAEANGLGKSYMERVFECDLYSNENENYVTKLIRNYRCHPEILYLPSILFYKGELIACRDDNGYLIDKVDFLPNREFPILFFGIQGLDEREGSNPSWFNRIEASKVVEVINKLTSTGNFNEEDIGVITPYRKQVLKLKTTLEDWDMSGIKVGSVEQFQGQEKQVIIVSTVRSTIKHNEFDRTHCLGFLSNSRRFNVAVTRAISLLIIIGNPHIITMDPFWNKLLWRCVDNNSYKGCAPPERQEDHFNYNEEKPSSSEDAGCGQQSLQTNLPEPVTDEAEWSDGWK